MPSFALAALWNASALPEEVAWLVEELAQPFAPGALPELIVALRETEANLEIRVDRAVYPRAAVLGLAEGVAASGGRLLELWRLTRSERDAFRSRALAPADAQPAPDARAAARQLEAHLRELATRGPLPAAPPDGPPGAAIPGGALPSPRAPGVDTPPPPEAPRGEDLRRSRRYAVQLEVAFRTELDFVREHAMNISNGGLFVRTSARPAVDSVVAVDVELPSGERLQGEALVVHHREGAEGGVGLAFLSDEPQFAATLDRYLASLVG